MTDLAVGNDLIRPTDRLKLDNAECAAAAEFAASGQRKGSSLDHLGKTVAGGGSEVYRVDNERRKRQPLDGLRADNALRT